MRLLLGLPSFVVLLAVIGIGLTGTPAKAEFVSQNACKIADPPANCHNLYASTVTEVVSTTAKRVRGSPHDGDCEQPLTGELDYSNLLSSAVKSVGSEQKFLNFTGDVVNMVQKDTLNFLNKYVHGDLGAALNRNVAGTQTVAVCAPLMVIVPADATVVGFRLHAGNYGKDLPVCAAASNCSIGYSAFFGVPHEVRADGARAYAVTFSNWSHDTSRVAALTVFFASAEPPLTSM